MNLLKEQHQEAVHGIVYIGSPDNPNYIEEKLKEDLVGVAKIISKAEGPSGKNVEYLFNLANFVRSLDLTDSYLFTLESLVKVELNK